jgi:hypothetical protein
MMEPEDLHIETNDDESIYQKKDNLIDESQSLEETKDLERYKANN